MQWDCLCGLGAGSRLERGAARGGRAMRREERARLRSARDDRSKRAGRAATSDRFFDMCTCIQGMVIFASGTPPEPSLGL